MQSNFKIMNMIGVIFLTYRRQLQKELNPCQITLQQYRILKYLAEKGSLYPSEIAELLFCDRPTASVVIKNIEKKYWIKKEKDPENGKQIKITLTAAGLQKFRDLGKVLLPVSNLSNNNLTCFTKAEQKQFEKLLTKFWNHIKAD